MSSFLLPLLGFITHKTSGFFQHGSISISTFISWITEVCYIPTGWVLYPSQFNNNRAVGGPALDSGSADNIQPGRYVIGSPGKVSMFLVRSTCCMLI